jgi:hypothetical protein
MIKISVFEFILSVFAVWRLAHLISQEDGPFDLVFRLRKLLGNGFFGSLLDCFYGISLWIAVPFALLFSRSWTEGIIVWLAISGGAGFIFKITEQK